MNTNKGKGIWIALIAALAVIIIVAIVVVLSANRPAKKYQKQLELAERYLEDLDYDQAIAAYRAAIAIDPKNPKAYEALAELYIDQGEDEKALEILNAGVEETQAEELKKLATETETRIAEAEAAKAAASDNSGNGENAAGQGEDGSGTDSGNTGSAYIESLTNDEGYIVFGHYEQDGDESNGPEPIEWDVLEDNGDSILLLSRYILESQPYNTESTYVTWEICSLRKWLNDDFLSAAFTPEEQERIKTVTISNPDNKYYAEPNSNFEYYAGKGGNDTEDKMFCLSMEEIMDHYSFNSWDDEYHCGYSMELMSGPTMQAMNNGVWDCMISQEDYEHLEELDYYTERGFDESCIGLPNGRWWLRTPGMAGFWACFVCEDGNAGWNQCWDVTGEDIGCGVRPAFYLEK